METHKKVQVIVGAFLLFGLFLIMVTIFMLGADKAFFTKYSQLHVYFSSVQGLDRGSIVSLAGVNVGNIESIDFLTDKQVLDITMRIDERFLAKIPANSQVEIRTQGALGDKYLYILPGSDASSSVKDGGLLTPAAATDLLGIISERSDETYKIFDIISDLHTMTQEITKEQKLKRIMNNLAEASEHLNASSKDARKITSRFAEDDIESKVSNSLEKLETIMTRIEKGQGTLGALINDPSLHEKLKALLGGNQRKTYMKDLLRTSIEKAEDGK